MKDIYGVFGAGGFGREVMPLARLQLQNQGISIDRLFFVDNAPEISELNGTRVISLADFQKLDAERRHLTCAIADSQVRSSVKNRLQGSGILDWTIMAGNCVVMDQVTIGAGSIICPFTTITSNVVIGSGFHANIYSYVAHDCVIGDFVTFAPGVKCNGNVVVGNHAYIGTGAIIRPGKPGSPITIGEAAVIGMGSIVTKNVPPGATVFGNPAKVIKRAA
jgi:sugar O-acyltransferase (sialic acid O-acetyltransferase NeuD family)